jgi:hypothetical protein
MPVGFARRIETSRGLDLDVTLFALSAAVILTFVVACAVVAGWRSMTADRRTPGRSASPVERVVAGVPSAPAAVGLRNAFSRGRGDHAVPVRSALLGVVGATTGVVAVLAFSSALSHLVDTPRLYGWSYDVGLIDTQFESEVKANPAVEALAEFYAQFEVRVAGRPTYAMAFGPIEGDIEPVITSGRAPELPGEIALGGDTLAATGLDIGDTVRIEGVQGALSARVVGRAVFPQADDTRPLADGVYLHHEDVEVVGVGEGISDALVVKLRSGTDARAFAGGLIPDGGEDEAPTLPVPPAEIEKVQQIEALPRVLGAFLVVLGLIALAHSLAVSARRRAGDFAVLRALGFRPRDVKSAVSWQAASTGAVGAVIGIPLGVLLGRFAWSRVAANIGVLEVQRVPALVLLAAIPVAVVLAVAIALVPARRAARLRPAEVLRSE